MTQWGEDLKKEIENLDDDDFLLFVLDTPSSRIFLDLKQVDVRQTGQNKEYTIILSERWCIMNLKRYIPLKQKTTYSKDDGSKWICEWRMFLTKPFHIHHTRI